MSAFLDSSSQIIGDYMLRGWTLTDRTCVHCHLTPLMRQPLREVETEVQREEFCATCQGGPGREVRPPQSGQSSSTANVAAPQVNSIVNGINGHSRSVSDSTSFGDLSSSKSSEPDVDMRLDIPFDVPTPIQPAAPAARNPPHAERDAQSARASSLIGDMLLRGYSLLADSCPNSTCYGIPLVGQPRTRRPGGRETGLEDTRKQCVICNRVYDKNGNLVQGGSTARTDAPPAAVNGVQDRQRAAVPATESSALDSPRTLARRALYADGEQANVALRTANKAIDQPEASKALPESKTKLRASDASKSHQVVSESVDTLVTALERLNAELRRMMEHPDIGRTIKDKGMKRCLTRMRDTMEALATAEEVRAKMEQ